ncbi:DUF6252 family protein [Flavobacterium sp.]|uniref:DUF6252 family protein n=1 Tax=Flavobacterium sp. TaxID=239 RepID=UPI0025D72B00|nr:DUF6252 family protein [Flavobacterium sp.]
MKNIKLLAGIFLILTAFTFSSCETEPIDSAINLDDFGNHTGGGGAGTFTAKIGSDVFNAQQIIAQLSGSAFGPEINIVGMMPNGKSMSIQLINPAVGTFTANTNFETLLFFQYTEDLTGTNAFSSFNSVTSTSAGTVTITKYDVAAKKISGTFSFTGYNSSSASNVRQITEGIINNVTFTVAP